MNEAIDDGLIVGYEELTATFADLGGDAHVVAAAVVGRVDLIVTANLGHFPPGRLGPYHISVQGPDDFLLAQWGLGPDGVMASIEEQAQALRSPPISPIDVVSRLRSSVPRFADTAAEAFTARLTRR
jgi:hypothetical protein